MSRSYWESVFYLSEVTEKVLDVKEKKKKKRVGEAIDFME
jgi:hypothetical protein